MLDLNIVIVNYNGGSLLTQAVAAALGSAGVSFGISVVDNASTDTSIALLEQALLAGPGETTPVVILRAANNLGFSSGNNLGATALPARYLALLNPDAVVTPDTFKTLVDFLDEHQDAGACAPRLNWPDGQAQAFSYGGDPTVQYLLRRAFARRAGFPLHDWAPAEPLRIEWAAGTCLVVRWAALATTGLLDDRIFMYFEDNDLCLRLRQRGWHIYFVPTGTLTHHNRPSYADRERIRRYYRGLELFYRKHYGALPATMVRLLSEANLLRKRK